MRFELKLIINSFNQDVVDFPKDTVKKAVMRAYKEVQLMAFAEGTDSSVHANIKDANGNTIGHAQIDLDMGEDHA